MGSNGHRRIVARLRDLVNGVFAAWMRLLLQVEGAVLWLVANDPHSQQNLLNAAVRAGVDPRHREDR